MNWNGMKWNETVCSGGSASAHGVRVVCVCACARPVASVFAWCNMVADRDTAAVERGDNKQGTLPCSSFPSQYCCCISVSATMLHHAIIEPTSLAHPHAFYKYWLKVPCLLSPLSTTTAVLLIGNHVAPRNNRGNQSPRTRTRPSEKCGCSK